MRAVFTDDQLRAQILYYLWNQGSWSEIYTNLDKMKNRLSNVVKNNGKNIFQNMDKKGLKLDQSDVVTEIKAYRKAKRKKAKD